ncbi:aminotransferase class I/II-fold pyridoxal phosphate-dependent enzyme [Bacillus sp. FJAT-29790]|uniref:aminotransferase class I/II-fold pyridoxal phosphate-dependent enzyme n=1 Tax=Bacillus sp. FJAT-29790 TaxID=1895002 RepID=UPI001C242474|nr:aminotransferase class I/II-fold pyridoxal phosphate-dependent enzyme [Bacillus sp. FJAT-29790]MBU8881438.1 aminotransferase class I/II-fold pyridoxal phosphate-dependent enzyme [Bacillus sp. FJAT-29790]
MDQKRKPLFEQLIKHIEKKPVSFHVPGHKYGQLFPKDADGFFKEMLKLDVTELSGLDDLHSSEGVILEAEELLAQLYGVKKSFFLVNGSTVGNLAMIMAAVEENDTVLVQRNCHKSILNGISLVKADPVFLGPDFDEDWGVAGGVSVDTVKMAIDKYPDAKAIILTYPNYYGMVNELEEIIELSHFNGIPVLIDEAHGAHFVRGGLFPRSAVKLKADIVVQSAHKTLPAMTMGAFLHYNTDIISERDVRRNLAILQSSSPSYPIMASLDIARSYLATYSNNDAECLLQKVNELKKGLKQLKGIEVLSYRNGIGDPLKITIQSTSSLSGYDIQDLLENEGIYPEMADPFNVLLVVPLLKSDMKYPIDKIVSHFHAALKFVTYTKNVKRKTVYGSKPNISKLAMNAKERAALNSRPVSLDEAIGKISAQLIIPYPPGIPLLFPGEIIRWEDIQNIRLLLETGARFQDWGSLRNGKIDIFST